MSEKILITSALPYANGPLHFGHIAGAYLPADCYARFQRLKGSKVLFLCGSDEYGIAISLSAEMAGRSPQDHVDHFHAINKAFFDQLDISFDHYSRTTWPGHNKTTLQYFQDLFANGYIEAKETDQLYSEEDDKFLADRYVIGTCPQCGYNEARGDECTRCAASFEATELKNPRSKLTGASLTLKKTTHWFLLLDKFKDQLLKWIETKPWKANVLNFVKSYITDLRPRAITRDTSWGIPVPLSEGAGKVLYVWFDAPIGYISAAQEWAQKMGDPEKWKDYWLDPATKLIQFIGKDNIPFHAVIFPAMTMGQNQPYKLVDELPANEFLNLEGRQFSKSEGWTIDLQEFLRTYSADQLRYTIAANAPETSDAEFTWKDFQNKCNTDLAGKFGNFVNRTLVFTQNNLKGIIPHCGPLEEIDSTFLSNVKRLGCEASDAYAHFKLRRASQVLMEIAQMGNVYFDSKKPWQDAKDPDQKVRLDTTLWCCLECIKVLALISYPILPQASQMIWEMLGQVGSLDQKQWDDILTIGLSSGTELLKPRILFRKVEDKEIEVAIAQLQKTFLEQKSLSTASPK